MYDNISIQDLYLFFHQNTKLTLDPGRGFDWEPSGNAEELAAHAEVRREYTGRQKIELCEVVGAQLKECDLRSVMRTRRSTRHFLSEELSLESLSKLLYFSAGSTGSEALYGDKKAILTANPSAGGLASSSLWIIPNRVAGLSKISYYHPKTHSLSLIPSNLDVVAINNSLLEFKSSHAAAAIVISSSFSRLIRKYGQRGYRYAYLDAGHLAQNICLVLTALGLSGYSSCGFIDAGLDNLLGLDGSSEGAVYVIYIGKSR